MSSENPVKLSIIVTTWNNEAFIKRCLNSILAQSVDYPIEILVGNDASTDSTPEIVERIAAANSEVFRIFHRKPNLGTSENFIDLVYRAKGEYIAQVDGDDNLTDLNKFQIQTDFLDHHPECSICFHHYSNQDDQGNALKPSVTPFEKDTITDLDLLLTTTLGPGNTTVFKRSALPEKAPNWLRECGNHKDFAIQFLVASKGRIGYIHRVMSAYTIHETNITKIESFEKLLRNSILINQGFLAYHKQLGIKQYQDVLKFIVNQRILGLAFFQLQDKSYLRFLGNIFNVLVHYRHWNIKMMKDAMYEGAPNLAEKFKRILSGSKQV